MIIKELLEQLWQKLLHDLIQLKVSKSVLAAQKWLTQSTRSIEILYDFLEIVYNK